MTSTAFDPVVVCAALADDTRWQVLQRLGEQDRSASELAELLPVSRQAIGKHLQQLEAAGLVQRHRDGRSVRYRALGGQLSRLGTHLDMIGRAWEERLGRLREVAEALADDPQQ